MGESDTCIKEGEFGNLRADIRVLEQAARERDKKIDRIKAKYEDMNEMNTSLKLMNLTLEQVSEHNQKQDLLQEKRDELSASQNKTLEDINSNLTNLSESHKGLYTKVDTLEGRFNEAENKSTIDLRDLNKGSTMDYMRKNVIPVGLGATIALILAEIVKAFL